MNKTVLITGGAGFIASHCAALLLQHNYRVKALDNLDAQIHGSDRRPPSYLDRRGAPRGGGVRSPKAVNPAPADVGSRPPLPPPRGGRRPSCGKGRPTPSARGGQR